MSTSIDYNMTWITRHYNLKSLHENTSYTCLFMRGRNRERYIIK